MSNSTSSDNDNFFESAWDDYKDDILDVAIAIGISILICCIGWPIANCLTGSVKKILARKNDPPLDPTITGFFLALFKFGLRFLLLILVMGQLGISTTSFIAIAGASAFAIAFALQGAVGNFAAGVMLLFFRPFKVGDWVNIVGESGHVIKIELFNTVLETLDGKRIICPNGAVTADNITNLTVNDKLRVDMVFGIAYSDDIKLARRTLIEILSNDMRVLKMPPPGIKVESLGDNSVNLICRPWVRPENYFDVLHDTHASVKLAFDKVGLNFPFPQRDVHVILEGKQDEDAAAMAAMGVAQQQSLEPVGISRASTPGFSLQAGGSGNEQLDPLSYSEASATPALARTPAPAAESDSAPLLAPSPHDKFV